MKRLLKVGLVVGGIAVVAKVVGMKKAEWTGLTESELRAKLDAKLPAEMPPERRTKITEKVVHNLHERGMVREETSTSLD